MTTVISPTETFIVRFHTTKRKALKIQRDLKMTSDLICKVLHFSDKSEVDIHGSLIDVTKHISILYINGIFKQS
jgi:hypothetical protein